MPQRALRTEELSYNRDGATIRAYGAWRPRDERLPGLVIVPDVHGLSDLYREIAERFANEGFFALALDPYSREGKPTLSNLSEINEFLAGLDDAQLLGDIAGAGRFLRSRLEVRKIAIGVTGFCMGGQFALLAACSQPEFAACVSFYGMLRYERPMAKRPHSPLDLAPSLHCPYLGLFGAEDPLIPAEDVRELETILRRQGKTFEIKSFAGAGHAFCNDRRPDAYRPEAAADAFARAASFLHTHLRAI